MCEKMLAHWVNREAWIGGIGPNFELCEVWDGSRFNELSWFWNPDKEWVLPYRCHCCGNVITVERDNNTIILTALTLTKNKNISI